MACPEREDEYLTRDSVDFHRRMGYRLAGEFFTHHLMYPDSTSGSVMDLLPRSS